MVDLNLHKMRKDAGVSSSSSSSSSGSSGSSSSDDDVEEEVATSVGNPHPNQFDSQDLLAPIPNQLAMGIDGMVRSTAGQL